MKSEEIAVLRILYKHNGPLKFSTLIEGFPDEFRFHIIDAVSRLQLLSYLNMTDCSSVLYIAINRQMRGSVLSLLEYDSKKYSISRAMEHDISKVHDHDHENAHDQSSHHSPNSKPPSEQELEKVVSKGICLRLPKRAFKVSASALVFSFVIIGTITVLGLQSTNSDLIYSGNEKDTPFQVVVGSSSLATEMLKGKTVPVEHVYDSEQNQPHSTNQPAIYEGIFTKLRSESSSIDEPPLYYHYLISEKQGLLLLEQIGPLTISNYSNSSLSSNSDTHLKEISST